MGGKIRIGLFGGSFDPIHNGHLQLAWFAKNKFKLDKIIFIPAKQPPHKKTRKLTSHTHRIKMLSIALKSYLNFLISRFELNNNSPTYTYQTVNYYAKKYSKAEIYFILGSDSLREIKTWKNYKLIAKKCKLIAGKRDNMDFINLPFEVYFINKRIKPVSSSQIRKNILKGKSIKNLTPKPVEKYIIDRGLYSGKNN